eukprot:1184865-Prorocentrum_minimum.AAC.2
MPPSIVDDNHLAWWHGSFRPRGSRKLHPFCLRGMRHVQGSRRRHQRTQLTEQLFVLAHVPHRVLALRLGLEGGHPAGALRHPQDALDGCGSAALAHDAERARLLGQLLKPERLVPEVRELPPVERLLEPVAPKERRQLPGLLVGGHLAKRRGVAGGEWGHLGGERRHVVDAVLHETHKPRRRTVLATQPGAQLLR